MLAEEIQEVAKKVVEAGQLHAIDEDIAAGAPEEFLDPIMSHLMTDPVILPTSKVHKNTIVVFVTCRDNMTFCISFPSDSLFFSSIGLLLFLFFILAEVNHIIFTNFLLPKASNYQLLDQFN